MQLFNLTKSRKSLAEFVATKTYQDIQQSKLSVFCYLCQNYSVIIDEDLPNFIYHDTNNGCLINLTSKDDQLVLEILGDLLMLHYMIENPSPKIQNIISEETSLFVKCYNQLANMNIAVSPATEVS